MKKTKKFCLLLFLFTLILSIERSQGKDREGPLPFLKASIFSFGGEVGFYLEGGYLRSSLPPVQILEKTYATFQERRKEILEYEVQEGETLEDLAKKFNLKKETILWANNLSENSKLKKGEKLIILPVDGILHQIKEGETLSEIGKKYQVKVEEIVSFNEIEGDEIYAGEILIVPGGKMPLFQSLSLNQIPVPKNFFICPLPPCHLTQGLHWNNAVDFSNGKCGEYVLAAASGKVISAKRGWNGGAGNEVKISHSNGIITHYCHLDQILVEKGEEVYQGQIIGTVGKTGISTGCHLHFGVLGGENPFTK